MLKSFKMKFNSSLIITMLLSFTACLYFPWWSIAIVAFLVSVVIPQSGLMSFVTGFCALFLLWGGLSYWISINNDHLLSHKLSLLILKTDNPYFLILATALTGALTAGFAAMAGSFVAKLTSITSKRSPSTG